MFTRTYLEGSTRSIFEAQASTEMENETGHLEALPIGIFYWETQKILQSSPAAADNKKATLTPPNTMSQHNKAQGP
jgi:hypothetical protein